MFFFSHWIGSNTTNKIWMMTDASVCFWARRCQGNIEWLHMLFLIYLSFHIEKHDMELLCMSHDSSSFRSFLLMNTKIISLKMMIFKVEHVISETNLFLFLFLSHSMKNMDFPLHFFPKYWDRPEKKKKQ